MAYSLENILKLTHPFAPFVTEVIWQTLKRESDSLLITSPWPTALSTDNKLVIEFESLQTLITDIRNLSVTSGLVKPSLLFASNDLVKTNTELVKKLAKLGNITEVETGEGLKLATSGFEVWLDVDATTRQKIAEQLANKLATEQGSVKNLKARLSNKSYVDNAPRKLVDETKAQLEAAEATIEALEAEITRFQ